MSLLRGLVSARTWLAFTHHVAGLCLAIVSFTIVVTGLASGVALLPLALAGLPVLGLTFRFAGGVRGGRRAEFPPPPGPPHPRRARRPGPRLPGPADPAAGHAHQPGHLRQTGLRGAPPAGQPGCLHAHGRRLDCGRGRPHAAAVLETAPRGGTVD